MGPLTVATPSGHHFRIDATMEARRRQPVSVRVAVAVADYSSGGRPVMSVPMELLEPLQDAVKAKEKWQALQQEEDTIRASLQSVLDAKAETWEKLEEARLRLAQAQEEWFPKSV